MPSPGNYVKQKLKGRETHMKLTLNVSNRKPLVDLISRFAGEVAVYMRMPTYAYQIGGYTVTREGNLEIPDDMDFTSVHALYEALADGGYHPKEAAPVSDNARDEETVIPNIEEGGENTGFGENIGADETARAMEQVKPVTESLVEDDNVSDTLETSGLSADILRQLNSLRASLIREVNRQINEIIRTGGAPRRNPAALRDNSRQVVASEGAMRIGLHGDISTLRGTKPTLVKYGDSTIPVSSWKRAFAAVLDICNRQEHYHEALLSARNETMGRSRKVIADSPQGMLSPLKIDDSLYIETNFSTEALLKLLRDRILNRIDFDSRSISFEYWRP